MISEKERLQTLEQIKNILEERGFRYQYRPNNSTYVAAFVGGLKAEYNYGSGILAVKLLAHAKNDYDTAMDQMTEWVFENYGEESIVNKPKQPSSKCINFLQDLSIDDYIEVVQLLSESEFDLEFKHSDGVKAEKLVGVTFQDTIFENLKERGATMSGMFGSLVCKAAKMKLENTLAEYYTNAGEIDGVEIDPETGDVLAIYECQSGIHNGDFLDETHLNKAFGKYLYDSKVLPTVRKVVVLAGGYYEDQLSMVSERAKELGIVL